MYDGTSIIVTAILYSFIAIIAVCLRFFVRLRLRPTYLGIDDWMITFACLLVCLTNSSSVISVIMGTAAYDGPPDPRRAYVQSKANYATLVAEKITYGSIKISVLLFYRRIFTVPTFRRINNIVILLIAIWAIIFLFVEVFLCSSTSDNGGPCPSDQWRLLWFAITDVITDIIVLTMPYPMIKRLQMSRRDKIGLIGIFSLGTLSVIAGIVRLGFVAQRFALYFHPTDAGKQDGAPGFWTTTEISIGVLAACLPPLGPLIRRIPNPYRIRSFLKSVGSRKAGSTEEILRPTIVSDNGWINLQDSKRSEG